MEPKISLNKLAEYLEADSARRRKIVFDQKYPKPFITTRYAGCRDKFIEYLSSEYDEDLIIQAISALEEAEVNTDFQENDRDSSIAFFDSVLDGNWPGFTGFEIKPYDGSNPKLEISGVKVSVNPDGVISKGNKVGYLKVHISKTNILSEEGLLNVATILHLYAEQTFSDPLSKIDRTLCLAFDGFGKQFSEAPASFKRRRDKISTACEEIALWWNNL